MTSILFERSALKITQNRQEHLCINADKLAEEDCLNFASSCFVFATVTPPARPTFDVSNT